MVRALVLLFFQQLVFMALLVERGESSLCPSGSYATSVAFSTLAGGGTQGAKDGKAAAAEFDHPESVTASGNGKTILVTDRWNHMVRSVDVATRKVTTLAGSGDAGLKDGPTSQARFSQPLSATYLRGGKEVAVADSSNHAIRLIHLDTNRVSTLAGTGVDGWEDGPAREATFRHPTSVVALPDGSGVVVADTFNHRLRIVRLGGWDGPYVETLAGARRLPEKGDYDGVGGEARFSYPRGMAVTADGKRLVVADSDNHKIKVVTIATGEVLTLSGVGERGHVDGFAQTAMFDWPFAVALTPDGIGVAVADTDNNAVRLVSMVTGETSTLAGPEAGLKMPRGVVVLPDLQVLVADWSNHRIRAVQATRCAACNNSIPEHARYEGYSLDNECPWGCIDGHYDSALACKSCEASRGRAGSGKCPIGYHLDSNGGECADLPESKPCIECAWTPCGVGEYRTACEGEARDGECAACSNKPLAFAEYTSSGTPGRENDCQWKCAVGYFIQYSDGSTVGVEDVFGTDPTRGGRSLQCVKCTDKPANARFTTNGIIPTRDSCEWDCESGYYKDIVYEDVAVCRPYVGLTAHLLGTQDEFNAKHRSAYRSAVASVADVPVESIRIEKAQERAVRRQLTGASGRRGVAVVDVQTVVLVTPGRQAAVYGMLTADALQALLNVTVLSVSLEPLPMGTLLDMTADVEEVSAGSGLGLNLGTPALAAIAGSSVLLVGVMVFFAVRRLRRAAGFQLKPPSRAAAEHEQPPAADAGTPAAPRQADSSAGTLVPAPPALAVTAGATPPVATCDAQGVRARGGGVVPAPLEADGSRAGVPTAELRVAAAAAEEGVCQSEEDEVEASEHRSDPRQHLILQRQESARSASTLSGECSEDDQGGSKGQLPLHETDVAVVPERERETARLREHTAATQQPPLTKKA